ncbi:MAG: UxaA family hydrolase [Candidatus Nanoarchaeia archaeon]
MEVSEVPKLSSVKKSLWRTVVVINPKDNVATTLKDLKRGQLITIEIGNKKMDIVSLNTIPFGHKIALRKIGKGEDVLKYGEAIGRATRDIRKGEHVHIHNVESKRGRGQTSVNFCL